jgi:hypothetical protein
VYFLKSDFKSDSKRVLSDRSRNAILLFFWNIS